MLRRFRAAVTAAYGARIGRVVLVGSRARGDARPDSDYDIAVFLDRIADFGDEANRLAQIETDVLYDTGAVINALPFQDSALRAKTGLMSSVRDEGVEACLTRIAELLRK